MLGLASLFKISISVDKNLTKEEARQEETALRVGGSKITTIRRRPVIV